MGRDDELEPKMLVDMDHDWVLPPKNFLVPYNPDKIAPPALSSVVVCDLCPEE